MRTRLYEPAVPWQTYAHTSIAAHSLQPTGLVLRLGLAHLAGDSSELLGDGDKGGIQVWRRFVPAHVVPGRHSLNGSDYTQFEVRDWAEHSGGTGQPMARRNATIVFETTALASADGGACAGGIAQQCDLLARITCSGADCRNMAVSLSGSFEWGRTGAVAAVGTTDLDFTAPGFPAVTAFTATGCSGPAVDVPASLGDATRRLIRFGDGPDGGVVGVSTGSRRTVAAIAEAVAAAQVRSNVVPLHLEHVADLALPLFDVLIWNTLYSTGLHVYTPVSRTFGADTDDNEANTFVWDVFFAAVMFALGGPGGSPVARDLAYANIITTVYSRTVTGMVPNYRTFDTDSGGQFHVSCTYDRTEPMVGSWSLEIVHSVFGDSWVVELLFAPLFGWNQWVWDRRTAEGSLGIGNPDGKTALISLGSDGPPLVPDGLNTPHTLSAARYESGLDNSPQYDGPLHGNEGYGLGPLKFNASTFHMELYDVAFTAYHARDGRALLSLADAAGVARGPEVAALRARVAATEAALHRDLYDPSDGQYSNKLYNGTFYKRWAPTVFTPMLLNSTSADRIAGMAEMMGDPATFCVADDPADGGSTPTYMWRMGAASDGFLNAGQSITCASSACLQSTVLGVADFVGIEAIVDTDPTAAATVALRRYQSSPAGDLCLSTESPGPGYGLVNASEPAEGWCAPGPAASGDHTVPVVLWYSRKLDDHRTCGGGASCTTAKMKAAGYTEVKTLCFGRTAGSPAGLPCRYGLPSIERRDSAFWDQARRPRTHPRALSSTPGHCADAAVACSMQCILCRRPPRTPPTVAVQLANRRQTPGGGGGGEDTTMAVIACSGHSTDMLTLTCCAIRIAGLLAGPDLGATDLHRLRRTQTV